MSITFAEPPPAVLTALEAALPKLGRSAAIEARSPAIGRAARGFAGGAQLRIPRRLDQVANADAIATPVYVLGVDDLIRGKVVDGAKLALWSHILSSEAGPVSAEVDANTARFAQISDSRAAARLRNRITMMATSDEGRQGEYQVAQLRVPALHLTLLWLKSTDGKDLFEPVEATGNDVQIGQHYTQEQLVAALRAPAAARAANGGEG